MRQSQPSSLIWGLALVGCATLGPKANVSLVKEEVAKTKTIENVVIPSATGIDATGNTGKALLATALGAYGTRGRPTAALSALLSNIPGVPAQTGDLLLAGYQAEFARVVEKFRKDGVKPTRLTMPSRELGFAVPSGIDGIKVIAPKLQDEASVISGMAQTIQSGDAIALGKALDQSKLMRPLLQKMAEALFEKLDCNYALLTHVVGSEQDWNGGQEVQVIAALVNVKTGAFRYFADVKATKGTVGMPYVAQLGTMSGSLFSSVIKADPLPAEPDDDDAPPAKKGPGRKSTAEARS